MMLQFNIVLIYNQTVKGVMFQPNTMIMNPYNLCKDKININDLLLQITKFHSFKMYSIHLKYIENDCKYIDDDDNDGMDVLIIAVQ